jgi:hypothetical protein
MRFLREHELIERVCAIFDRNQSIRQQDDINSSIMRISAGLLDILNSPIDKTGDDGMDICLIAYYKLAFLQYPSQFRIGKVFSVHLTWYWLAVYTFVYPPRIWPMVRCPWSLAFGSLNSENRPMIN